MGTEKSWLRSCDCLLNQDSNPGPPDPESVFFSTQSLQGPDLWETWPYDTLFFFFTSGKLLEHLEEMNFLWGVPWALLPEKYNPRAPHLWYPPTGNQCHAGRCPSSQRSLPVLQSWHMHSAAAVLWGRVLSYWGPGLGIWDEALC